MALDPWTTDLTDGVTIQSVVNVSTNAGIAAASNGRRRHYGLESTAHGNGYAYSAFFDLDGNVYFSRTDDSANTWDAPTVLYAGASGDVQATSIDAVGNEVFVIYSVRSLGDLYLVKSTDSGDSWTTFTIYNGSPNFYIYAAGIAVDPTNTNYVSAMYNYGTSMSSPLPSPVYQPYSSDGGETWTYNPVAWSTDNGPYGVDIVCGAGGTFYAARHHNYSVYVKKSTDHGQTWPTSWTSTTQPGGAGWGQALDLAADPMFDDIVYLAVCRCGWTSGHNNPRVGVAKTTNGNASWTWLDAEIEDDIEITDNSDQAMQPSITMARNGDVYVAFTFCLSTSPSDYDIFIAKTCDYGATLFTDCLQVNADTAGLDVSPSVVLDEANGGICITWAEDGYSSASTAAINPGGKITSRHITE